ncbi:MAG: CehA/McbA family metallohydrolase, partial [Polyangia bacterium]
RLTFTVIDADTGQLIPARVIFRPPPHAGFADSLTSGSFSPLSPGGATGAVVGPGVLGSPEGVLLANGFGTVPVPPGSYSLFITRGPEYEAVQDSVKVHAGEEQQIEAVLDRTVDTRGWLAADMHVHLARSFDSQLPGDRRVISMVTNGIEVIVPTDHNVATDLGPTIQALGYGPELVGTISGDEFNFKEGHGGAYPVPYQADQPYGGAPPWIATGPGGCTAASTQINCLTAARAFPVMHAQIPGETVVTVNHPFWPRGDLGYFSNIQWGAGTSHPLPTPLPTAGLFDALEVLNGYQARTTVENALLADWFYLLGQGYRVTALGNSDTHRINWVRAGFPRTWLRLPNDRPGDTTGAGLADAIKHGRAIASTGPFVTLTADGGQIGDVVVPHRPGQVAVDLLVDAPGWIEVDRVRVFVNGDLRRDFAVPPGRRPVFHARFDEPIEGDSWILALASGTKPLPPDVVGESSHANGWEMLPWAITNPIFIDADGNGEWKPSFGAPRGAPGTPTNPLGEPDLNGVPEGCSPDEVPTEPPLEAPEDIVLPLLHF